MRGGLNRKYSGSMRKWTTMSKEKTPNPTVYNTSNMSSCFLGTHNACTGDPNNKTTVKITMTTFHNKEWIKRSLAFKKHVRQLLKRSQGGQFLLVDRRRGNAGGGGRLLESLRSVILFLVCLFCFWRRKSGLFVLLSYLLNRSLFWFSSFRLMLLLRSVEAWWYLQQ